MIKKNLTFKIYAYIICILLLSNYLFLYFFSTTHAQENNIDILDNVKENLLYSEPITKDTIKYYYKTLIQSENYIFNNSIYSNIIEINPLLYKITSGYVIKENDFLYSIDSATTSKTKWDTINDSFKQFSCDYSLIKTVHAQSYYDKSGDGDIYKEDSANWNDTHDATSGQGTNYSGSTALFARTGKTGGGNYSLTRAFLTFDTYSIGSSYSVASATLYIYPISISATVSGTYDYVNIFSANPVSTTSIITADFDSFGTTAFTSNLLFSSATTSKYNSLSLNGSATSSISTTNSTNFSFREGFDISDTAYSGSNATANSFSIYSADQSGTEKDPYLILSLETIPVATTSTSTISGFGSDLFDSNLTSINQYSENYNASGTLESVTYSKFNIPFFAWIALSVPLLWIMSRIILEFIIRFRK